MNTNSIPTSLPVNTIHHGDCIQIMRQMLANSADLILTDPPYLVNYRDRDGRSIQNDAKADWLKPAMREAYRVLKQNRVMVCFYGWTKVDMFFDAWKDAGFQPVGHLVFRKTYSSRSRFLRYQHEQAYLLAKGRPPLPKQPLADVMDMPYSGNKLHPSCAVPNDRSLGDRTYLSGFKCFGHHRQTASQQKNAVCEPKKGAPMARIALADEHPVDARLPPLSLLLFALQHVLTMYSSSITGPLVLGASLHLPAAKVAYLVSADLFACGLVTIVQCLGFGPIGIRLPVMMGVTFAAIGPAIVIASDPSLGLAGVFGATIASGLLGMLIAPWFGRCMRLFTPVVTGATLLLIGVSLMTVGVRWVAGTDPTGAADLGSICVALLVIATTLAAIRFGRGPIASMAVLLGIIVGFSLSGILGQVHLSSVVEAPWLRLVRPFAYGAPRFRAMPIISMTIVMLVTMVESTGMFFALGNMVDRPVHREELTKALRADAAGGLLGGIFGSLPMTSYSQNIAIVAIAGARSRYVCVAAGVLLMLLGTIPKLAFLVTCIPNAVLGGAALVMFGMVAASGIAIISEVDLRTNRKNLYVIAVGLSMGLIPAFDPAFFAKMPTWTEQFLHSGILVGTVTLVVLNLLLNGLKSPRDEQELIESALIEGETIA